SCCTTPHPGPQALPGGTPTYVEVGSRLGSDVSVSFPDGFTRNLDLGPLPPDTTLASKPFRPLVEARVEATAMQLSMHPVYAPLPPPAHRPVDLHLGVLLLERLPAVVGLLALGEPDLDLGEPVAEVDLQRHEGEAALGGLAHEALDLVLVEQQLAGAGR